MRICESSGSNSLADPGMPQCIDCLDGRDCTTILPTYSNDRRHEDAANGSVEDRVANTDNVDNHVTSQYANQVWRHALPVMQEECLYLPIRLFQITS